jgi:hypothetical protein
MQTIVKMVHGSHLYGLNTENSDTDYKGVFLPSLADIVQLNPCHEIRRSTGDEHSKNTKDDVDNVMFSLQKFLKMACAGETIAIDMLHALDSRLLESSEIWAFIRENRSKFYTRNMKAFLGYCKKQAAKYGIRGSRLDAMEKVILYLKADNHMSLKLGSLETGLRKLSKTYPEYVSVLDGFYKGEKFVNKQVLQVCESKYDLSCDVSYVVECMQKKYDAYGHRAQLAKNNEGVDFKAASHALRAGYQLKEIYETGDLQYPLKKADFLLQVKRGELDYTTVVAPALEMLIDEVELLAAKSEYPEKVDQSFWEDFIVKVYSGEFSEDTE